MDMQLFAINVWTVKTDHSETLEKKKTNLIALLLFLIPQTLKYTIS